MSTKRTYHYYRPGDLSGLEYSLNAMSRAGWQAVKPGRFVQRYRREEGVFVHRFGCSAHRPGSADEIAAILVAMGAGIAFGMGYIAYGVLVLVIMGLLFLALSGTKLFDHKGMQEEKLLKITIPESLDYARAFEEPFGRYLKESENVGVKTTGMGSMYRLSFKIRMKNPEEEKEMIDELRTRNGNLEIAVLPWAEPQAQL